MIAVTPETPESFSTPEACAAAGCSYRMADHWARTDLIGPSLRAARGSGSQRRYSYSDVISLAIVVKLIDAGIDHQVIRRHAPHFRGLTPAVMDGRWLALTAGGGRLVTDVELWDVIAEGGVVTVVPLAGVADDVDERLALFEGRRRERYATTHL